MILVNCRRSWLCPENDSPLIRWTHTAATQHKRLNLNSHQSNSWGFRINQVLEFAFNLLFFSFCEEVCFTLLSVWKFKTFVECVQNYLLVVTDAINLWLWNVGLIWNPLNIIWDCFLDFKQFPQISSCLYIIFLFSPILLSNSVTIWG